MSSDEGARGRQDENDPFDESGSYSSKHSKTVREKMRNLLDKKVVERKGKKSSHTHSGALVGGDQYLYEEYDDHMVGSAYHPDDLCPSCGAPRGGSVYCPVSQLQHSNDEPMDPAGKSSRSHKNVVSSSNVGPTKFEEDTDAPYSNDIDNMDPFESTAHASVGDNALPDNGDTYGASTAQEPCYHGMEETSYTDAIQFHLDPNSDDAVTPQNGEHMPYSRSGSDTRETTESEKRQNKGVFGKIASIFKKKPKHKSHEMDAEEKEKEKVILSDEAKKYIKSLQKKEEAHRKMISHEQTVDFRELLDDHKTAVKRMKKNISN